jgi:hypothetical protein
MPITENVRVGGVKEGKVRIKHRYDRMEMQANVHYSGQKVGHKEKRSPGIIRLINDRTRESYVLETLKTGKQRVLYYGDPTPKKMKKSLRFFETVRNTAARFAQKYLNSLVASMGNDKQIMASIKYITKM